MSVSPDYRQLPIYRLPIRLMGRSRTNECFEIETESLGPELNYLPDDTTPVVHGVVEPATLTTLKSYEEALAGTAARWRRTP